MGEILWSRIGMGDLFIFYSIVRFAVRFVFFPYY